MRTTTCCSTSAQVRRSFERAAARYDAAAVLQHEVCGRMLERLDYIKHAPARDTRRRQRHRQRASPALLRAIPRAPVVALDLALAMLERARARAAVVAERCRAAAAALRGVRRHRAPAARARGGRARLVEPRAAMGDELPRAFAEMHRVLAPGGLLMFSTFGPDTLKELRAAYAGTDGHTHVNRFIDMHDIGDMLVAAGYADPVMDMEHVDADLRRRARAHARPEGDRRAQRDARPAGGTFREIAARGTSSATTKRSAATASCPRRSKSSTATRGNRCRG